MAQTSNVLAQEEGVPLTHEMQRRLGIRAESRGFFSGVFLLEPKSFLEVCRTGPAGAEQFTLDFSGQWRSGTRYFEARGDPDQQLNGFPKYCVLLVVVSEAGGVVRPYDGTPISIELGPNSSLHIGMNDEADLMGDNQHDLGNPMMAVLTSVAPRRLKLFCAE